MIETRVKANHVTNFWRVSMKKAILLAAMSLVFTLGVACQDAPSVSTSALDGARFEVLQSTVERGTTFRLDKYLGVIDRLGRAQRMTDTAANYVGRK